jgi:hypothetical protein
MKPIVLCMQFWEKDKEKAMQVARLISEMQPAFTNDYHFMFVARHDAIHDVNTIRQVSRRFPVWTHTCTRKEIGWPAGPNGMASDMFVESLKRFRSGLWANVEAVWLLEADILPLTIDWLSRIRTEWSEAKKPVMGAWQPEWSPVGHVNGNMLFVPDLAARVRNLEGCPPHIPWDTYHAMALSRHWHKSAQMVNFYKRTQVGANELWPDNKEPYVFVHGIKDDSGIRHVRARLFGSVAESAQTS